MNKNVMTFELANKLFSLDAETGYVFRKQSIRSTTIGKRAGYYHKATQYRSIDFRGVAYKEHNIVFLLANGYWPTKEINHINGIKFDNRPINLEDISHADNCIKRPKRFDNKSGTPGVFRLPSGSWQAAKRAKYLGAFPTIEEAKAAYEAAP